MDMARFLQTNEDKGLKLCNTEGDCSLSYSDRQGSRAITPRASKLQHGTAVCTNTKLARWGTHTTNDAVDIQ